MRWIKGGIFLAIVLVLMVVGLLFSSHNTAAYSIDLIVLQLPEINISLLILASLVMGFLAGWLLSLSTYVKLKASQVRAERALKLAQKELDSLRIAGLKDTENE
jgi:uncharacterized membrane protein YciS (DUF1049 family)